MNSTKSNIIAFILGLVISWKLLPWFMHLIYIGCIIGLGVLILTHQC